MTWLVFAIGFVVGGGLVWAYYRGFNRVYAIGADLIGRARGDIDRALAHVRKL